MGKRQHGSSSFCSPKTTVDTSAKSVKSKYFSIESYFSSTIANKRLKSKSSSNSATNEAIANGQDLETEEAVNDKGKQEQCPICHAFILTESMSFEVHVNYCLDQQQTQTQEQKQQLSQEPEKIQLQQQYCDTKEVLTERQNCFTVSSNNVDEQASFEYGGQSKELDESTEVSFSGLVQKFSYRNCKGTEMCLPEKQQKDGEEKEGDVRNNSTTSTISKDTEVNGTFKQLDPTSWKKAFSSNTSSSTATVLRPLDINVNNNILLKGKASVNKKNKICPFYKWVKDTRFVVDAFNYGAIPNCDGYFLSHYHSDHFVGLTSKWSHGPIYCSKVTANLVRQELRVDPRYIHPLPMNQLYPIPTLNKSQRTAAPATVEVALIDANHCPGSVLFLFVIDKKIRHLHTGDFRAAPKMCLHPLLRQPENPPIGNLYLDTTYLDPKYAFPAQEECIQAVCNAVLAEINGFAESDKPSDPPPSMLDKWIRRPLLSKTNNNNKGAQLKPVMKQEQHINHEDLMTNNNAFELMMSKSKAKNGKTLFVVGTYTIGKERVFIHIARLLKCKVYAPSKKKCILLCQEDEELKTMLTNDPTEAQVHVVSLRDIRADTMFAYLHQYESYFNRLVAFKPTGWAFKSTESQTLDMKLAPLCDIILPPPDRNLILLPQYSSKKDSGKVKIYSVPYSEHSSFRELASFIASLDIRNIIPTVNNHNHESMRVYLDKWQEEKRAKRIEVVAYPNEDHW
ncbi:DNA repair metallo-beta-lactamase-domain-containing protein [Mycotypha africana]|uniref:DNA repair metallo-beta-lactamase-domain-containing protein n=1 Tax=Mycotypha africana TaxID=64632 RepID=UPI002300C717|nr:DNA repair metallo-beta-lactamase-domain-containing protein [Mycotypha africana]KAI8967006.1 DNA repair metallo-beta-lactamase-domain-containing protein [Mycotypha africana]